MLLVTLGAVMAFTSMAHAEPPAIVYKGRLKADGEPVNAVLDLTFEIFGSRTRGKPLWQERHQETKVVNGSYTVHLGTALKAQDKKRVFDGRALWLQVRLGREALGRRVPLNHAAGRISSTATSTSVLAQTIVFFPPRPF